MRNKKNYILNEKNDPQSKLLIYNVKNDKKKWQHWKIKKYKLMEKYFAELKLNCNNQIIQTIIHGNKEIK